MQQLMFLIEGRGAEQHSAAQVRELFKAGQITATTKLSRDGRQWFAAVQLLNRLPDEPKPRPPAPVLGP